MRRPLPDVELYSRHLRRTLLLHRSASGRVHAMVFVGRRRTGGTPVANAVALAAEDTALHLPADGVEGWLQLGAAMFDLAPDEPDAIARWLSGR
ncbi:MAG: hypothetical protein NW204_05670 [Xanthomonadaceae bacterium]|nr:hypothetical protein [Xanthomonadaceae bacterium]